MQAGVAGAAAMAADIHAISGRIPQTQIVQGIKGKWGCVRNGNAVAHNLLTKSYFSTRQGSKSNHSYRNIIGTSYGYLRIIMGTRMPNAITGD